MNRTGLLLLLAAAGCGFNRPDRERLGDIAWHDGRWTDAMADYASAGDSPRLAAKYADAALQAGRLSEAADAWTRLGVADVSRVGEAAAGLSRVAEAAVQQSKQPALAQAIVGLRRIAPGWPLGRMAIALGLATDLRPDDAVEVIPALLVASGRGASEDLLAALGQADRARGACDEAVPVLEGVVRRNALSASRDSAITSIGACSLGLGLKALDAGRPGEAERWLNGAVHAVPDSPVGRRALLGVGDAKAVEGDSLAARAAWQTVASTSGAPDSLIQMALIRLTQLTPALADSGTSPRGRP